MSYHIHLQQFEGPLSLLLYLIRKEEMDILNINVNEITKQYLEYIKLMKQFDLEVAGEFVAMAATLIHIKSRLLLPNYDENGEEIEEEDPRSDLVKKLLEFQKFQEAGKALYERPLLGRDCWSRGSREDLEKPEDEIILEGDNALFGLITAWRGVQKGAVARIHKVRVPIQSIASRISEIRHRLRVGSRVNLCELFDKESKEANRKLLITFLSALELAKMGYLRIFQADNFGDIYAEATQEISDDILNRVDEYVAATIESAEDSEMGTAEEGVGEETDEVASGMAGEMPDKMTDEMADELPYEMHKEEAL